MALVQKAEVTLAGMVTNTRSAVTKMGKPCGFVTIEDYSGSGELASAGREEMSPTPSREMMPRPVESMRMRSAVSNPGAPKNWPPPWDSSAVRARRMTPAVALETPPIVASSSLP